MTAITIADLLARNLAIEWFESVALVREVCTVLLSERVGESTPELAQILLDSTGTVAITGTAHRDAPVRRLGQLLQALLSHTSDTPVTLRLVLSEAMAAPPVYGSVAELDAALAYFERPDRYAVLRGLYERATSFLLEADGVMPVQDLDHLAPLPQASAAEPKRRKPAKRRPTAVVVVCALLAAAAAVAYQRELLFPRTTLKTASARATDAVDKTVLKAVSAVTEFAGMGKLVAPGTDIPRPLPAPAPSSSPAPRRRSVRAAAITLAGVPVRLFDPQPSSGIGPPSATPATVAPAVLEASADPARAIDAKVYGPEDSDVEAPRAIYPHLPTALPEGMSANELTRIELLVAPDGFVEAAKLVPGGRPISVTEAMLVSAAKAWRFTPAIKNGEAVRYRKIVFLSQK